MKFNRNYRITIQVTDATAIIIEPPLTIQFNIHRSVSSTLNSMTLQILNLGEERRNLIFQDRFDTRRFKIVVEIGYEKLSTVFIGDIYEANSARQGSNVITTIDARDGNFDTQEITTYETFQKGTSTTDILRYLFGKFPNIKSGNISSRNFFFPETNKFARPVVLEGNVYEIIKEKASAPLNNVFIDLSVINVLGVNEVIVNDALPLLDASTGLIETPRRDQSYLTVTTLLEPNVIMGQIVELTSRILPQYNGLYKVLGVTHKGIISGAVGGNAQSVFMLNGNQLLGGFSVV